jgi:hypothetical protein
MNQQTISAACFGVLGVFATLLVSAILLGATPAGFYVITALTLVPFFALLYFMFVRGQTALLDRTTGVALSAGGLIGVGFWFLFVGAVLNGIIDIGIAGFYLWQIHEGRRF